MHLDIFQAIELQLFNF